MFSLGVYGEVIENNLILCESGRRYEGAGYLLFFGSYDFPRLVVVRCISHQLPPFWGGSEKKRKRKEKKKNIQVELYF